MLINLELLTIANYFLLNIAEHENFSANKYENAVGIFIFISRENFMLSGVEHEKRFITSGPDLDQLKRARLEKSLTLCHSLFGYPFAVIVRLFVCVVGSFCTSSILCALYVHVNTIT